MELFGLPIGRKRKKGQEQSEAPFDKSKASFAPPVADDGAIVVEGGGFFGQYIDLDGSVRSDNDLMIKYREMAMDPICEMAIDDIINEAIVIEPEVPAIRLSFASHSDLSDDLKEEIDEEFKIILDLLEFKTKGYELFRQWYVDGKLYFHLIINPDKPENGLLEIRFVDPLTIKKLREILTEPQANGATIVVGHRDFYIYNKEPVQAANTNGIRIAEDAISFCASGLYDSRYKRTVSYLYKAIKPLNQLRMLEDSVVIYRLARAPEKRVFYIDTGDLPAHKAEEYMRKTMLRYRNKIVYDSVSGEIRDDRKFFSILDDYWIPRRGGGKGTEIAKLEGGDNLGEIKDVEYFQKKLYNSLNIPVSRLQADKGFQFGKQAEINRDELKFTKFVNRLQIKFSEILFDILRKQLILKGVVEPKDWDEIKRHITMIFTKDVQFSDFKETERRKIMYEELSQIEKYIGRYYSHEWVRNKVLKQTEVESKEMDRQITKEREAGMYKTDNSSYGIKD